MNVDIRFPNITADTPNGQLTQVKSYLHQLVEQLNWALNTVQTAQGNPVSQALQIAPGTSVSAQDAEQTFNSIKALIIKSADIVKAYEQTIRQDFNGVYLAQSDFGAYMEATSTSIETNSKGITEVFANVQKISNTDGTGSLDLLEEEANLTNAYIKRGLLGYDDTGKAIYGVEVGETAADGSFLKYARFKADRLSFYDAYGTEVAYIGAGCLYVVGKTVFLGEIQLGWYKTDTSDGLAFTWIGE